MSVLDDFNDLQTILPSEFFIADIHREPYNCALVVQGLGVFDFYAFSELYDWLKINYYKKIIDNDLTVAGVRVCKKNETEIYFSSLDALCIPFFQHYSMYPRTNYSHWQKEGF